jgi:murein L,D-transpeptidase YafK
MRKGTYFLLGILGVGCLVALTPLRALAKRLGTMVSQRFQGRKSVEDRLREYGNAAETRLRPYFDKASVPFPPRSLVMVVLKEEKLLELYAAGDAKSLRRIRSYPIQAASGRLGPKLREGDYQVPEGIYTIEALNPNSLYHLSLRVNYPNVFDRAQAKAEGRQNLGGDIMIHGQYLLVASRWEMKFLKIYSFWQLGRDCQTSK